MFGWAFSEKPISATQSYTKRDTENKAVSEGRSVNEGAQSHDK
jgi:hypothetical protein